MKEGDQKVKGFQFKSFKFEIKYLWICIYALFLVYKAIMEVSYRPIFIGGVSLALTVYFSKWLIKAYPYSFGMIYKFLVDFFVKKSVKAFLVGVPLFAVLTALVIVGVQTVAESQADQKSVEFVRTVLRTEPTVIREIGVGNVTQLIRSDRDDTKEFSRVFHFLVNGRYVIAKIRYNSNKAIVECQIYDCGDDSVDNCLDMASKDNIFDYQRLKRYQLCDLVYDNGTQKY